MTLYIYIYILYIYIYVYIYIYIYISIDIYIYIYIHIYSVFGSAFIKEVLSAISSFSKICLTSNYKYQGNYITKTKLIIDVTVISVY